MMSTATRRNRWSLACATQERLAGVQNRSSSLAEKLLSVERLLVAANATNSSAFSAVRLIVADFSFFSY